MKKLGGCLLTILITFMIWTILPAGVQEGIKIAFGVIFWLFIIGLFSGGIEGGGGGGTWKGGGTTSSGGTWTGGGKFSD